MKAFIFYTACTLVLLLVTIAAICYNDTPCAIAFLIGTVIAAFTNGVSLMVNIKD